MTTMMKKGHAAKKVKSVNNAEIRVRIDAKTKTKFEKVFKRYGMTTSDGIRQFVKQVAEENDIPRIPNAESRKAIKESLAGKGRKVTMKEFRALLDEA